MEAGKSFDELKYHPDDSLDIYIQHESPGAATSHCSLS
jgi:hypothetical protein